MCCKCAWHKKHDGNNNRRGLAWGVGKRAMLAGTVEFYQCGVLPAIVNLQLKSSIKRKKNVIFGAIEVL